jgi:methyl-accepting chemotaxis protein
VLEGVTMTIEGFEWVPIAIGLFALFASLWRFLAFFKKNFINREDLEKEIATITVRFNAMDAQQKSFEKSSEDQDNLTKTEIEGLTQSYYELSGQIEKHAESIGDLKKSVEKTNDTLSSVKDTTTENKTMLTLILEELRHLKG